MARIPPFRPSGFPALAPIRRSRPGRRSALALLCVTFLALPAHAEVPVTALNEANRAQLEALAGIGTVKAQAILAERDRHGHFASWEDFLARVPGFGPRSLVRLRRQGLVLDRLPGEFGAIAPTSMAGPHNGESPAASGGRSP